MPKIALMYSEDSLKGIYRCIGVGGVCFYLADAAGTIVGNPPFFFVSGSYLLRIMFVFASYFQFSVFLIFGLL